MSIVLTPIQSIIAKDTHRFRVACCGRRAGKTTLAVLEMIAKAVYGNDRQIAYVAPTYQQARDIAWQELKKLAQPAIHKVNESRLEIILNTVKGGTSTISLRGWENIETLRGQRFDFIVIDEIASMRNWNMNWQEVIRPTLTDVKGEALFISTPKGFNSFYDLYNLQEKDQDYKSFHFTSFDNPYIPKDEIDKAKQELTEDRFAQEYLADFRKTEGLVYKEFSRERHIFGDDKTNITETIAGVDFGFVNPSCILVIQRDNDNGYWVREEWYRAGKTNAELIEVAKVFQKVYNVVRYYPDPAEPARIEEMTRSGLNCRDVLKDIDKGIDSIRELFKSNRLHIHKSCENLIIELETYAYPDKKDKHNPKEEPIKDNDHALDALRYALFMDSPLIRRKPQTFFASEFKKTQQINSRFNYKA